MELTAVIQALEVLKRPCAIELYTDSQYVRQGITAWMRNWKARGWRTADGKPVKNEDLWRRLDAARNGHEVTWKWVKGQLQIRPAEPPRRRAGGRGHGAVQEAVAERLLNLVIPAEPQARAGTALRKGAGGEGFDARPVAGEKAPTPERSRLSVLARSGRDDAGGESSPHSTFNSASAPDASALEGASSTASDFTIPSSTTMA